MHSLLGMQCRASLGRTKTSPLGWQDASEGCCCTNTSAVHLKQLGTIPLNCFLQSEQWFRDHREHSFPSIDLSLFTTQ